MTSYSVADEYVAEYERLMRETFPRGVHGVIHVGACYGEEAPAYDALGWHTIWIEGNPGVIEQLRANVEPRGHIVIDALIGPTDRERDTLYVTTDLVSTSRLPLRWDGYKYDHDIVRPSITLDRALRHPSIGGDGHNLLVLDLQGGELDAIIGGEETLARMDYVMIEVLGSGLYHGVPTLAQLDAALRSDGFRRITETEPPPHGRGIDVAYERAR